jgi:anti-anti-sigma regulatory factor
MPEPRCRRAENNGNSGPLSLKLRDFREGDAQIIAVAGRFDGWTMDEIERELEHADGTDAQVIVLDLRLIDFIDSGRLKVVVMTGPRPPTGGRPG